MAPLRLALILTPLLCACTAPATGDRAPGKVRFAAITDCQYADAPDSGVRRYRDSERKLRECVEDLFGEELDFAIHLGDFIDRDFASFDVVQPIYAALPFPIHHVLGNHDFSVEDGRQPEVPERLGMPSRYYDFALEGWRFILLDGNDLSLHAWPAGTGAHRDSVAYRQEQAPDAPVWNGAIGPAQLAWLAGVLKSAEVAEERVLLFCHYPTLPGAAHSLWNAQEVLDLVESHCGVQAWINGHDHAGSFQLRNGIAHLNLKGMVDTQETAYAVLTLTPTTILVDGRGREPNRQIIPGSDID